MDRDDILIIVLIGVSLICLALAWIYIRRYYAAENRILNLQTKNNEQRLRLLRFEQESYDRKFSSRIKQYDRILESDRKSKEAPMITLDAVVELSKKWDISVRKAAEDALEGTPYNPPVRKPVEPELDYKYRVVNWAVRESAHCRMTLSRARAYMEEHCL